MSDFSFAERSVLRTVLEPAVKSMRFATGKTGRAFVPGAQLPKGSLKLAIGKALFEVDVTPLQFPRRDGNVFFRVVRVA